MKASETERLAALKNVAALNGLELLVKGRPFGGVTWFLYDGAQLLSALSLGDSAFDRCQDFMLQRIQDHANKREN